MTDCFRKYPEIYGEADLDIKDKEDNDPSLSTEQNKNEAEDSIEKP